MSITCARKGCRKKATYDLTLAKDDGTQSFRSVLQDWRLCPDDRDRAQAAISKSLEKFVVTPADIAAAGRWLSKVRASQTELDQEDRALRDQIARPSAAEETEHALAPVAEESQRTQDALEAPVVAARSRRPVARPTNA